MKKNGMRMMLMALLVTVAAGGVFAGGGGQSSTGAGGRELYRVEVYTQLANYAGMQVGWFAKLVKDKFNLELNIVPTSEGTYSTRMAAGNLGDLVVFGHNGEEFTTAIEAGMLLDWSKGNLLTNYGKDITANLSRALQQNRDMFGNGSAIYGFGHNVASSSSYAEAPFYHPDIRFDIYQAIGSPEIPNLMGYLDVLKRMVDHQPLGDSGLPAYAISLFSDWDGDTVMSVKAMGAFYGYDEFGFTLYNAATNTAQPVLDPDSYYMQGLKFFNKAYQMGILDPDSATQTFSDVSNKYNDGRVYWSIFSWLGPTNYNTPERLAAGKGMFGVPAKDQKNIVYGTSVYGGDRIWTIGAKARYPERIMELINWLCTPDGIMQSNWGPQGVTWDYDANNKPYLTPLGIDIHQGNPNVEMPIEAGGGLFVDGQNKINNTTFTLDEINPISGEKYNREYWSSELSREPSRARKIWQDAMGAKSEDEYLDKHNQKVVVVASDFVKETRSLDLEQKYKQVSTAIRDGTWRAIYAQNDAEYDRIVTEMISQAKGFGYDECVAWDLRQASLRAAAVRRAQAQ
jgi:multiple sugar transport system substrate-binding protein/putative aldouronate transport system substrate-binding protein